MILLHGLGGAADLPIPAPLAIAGGTIALLVSFTVLVLAWKQPRYAAPAVLVADGADLGDPDGRRVPEALARVLDGHTFAFAMRLLGLLFFGYVSWAIVAGPNSNVNPALGVFYVWVWVGVVPVSLLFGRVARAISPVRTISMGIARLLGGDPAKGIVEYPARLGYWPAAVGLVAFVWQELVNPNQIELPDVEVWLVVYLVIMLLGAAVFGDIWLERADPFEVYSDLLARMSFWGRDRGGRLVWRSPLANNARTIPRPGLVAVVGVLFGSTAYDSYKDSIRWTNFVDGIQSNPIIINSIALVCFCAVVGGSLTIAARTTRALPQVPHRELPMLLAHSVGPIIVGYMIAHYLSYFVEQGQQTLIFLSDPMGNGANLLGTSGWSVDLWLSLHPPVLAITKVVSVVIGHIVGVVAAHDRALQLLPERHRVTGQLGMLVLMLAYTTAGLYLLFGS